MWWITAIIKIVETVLPSATKVAGDVLTNQKQSNEQSGAENVAAQEAYAKEFSYPVKDRRTFDVIMDGVNRLPRPTMVFGIMSIPLWTCIDPPSASRAFVALALIPEPLWQIMMIVVCFYFTSRFVENVKIGKYTVDKATIEMARRGAERSAEPVKPAARSVPAVGLVQRPKDSLLSLAGYGDGVMVRTGFTGALPKSRAAGWRNPIAQTYAVETE